MQLSLQSISYSVVSSVSGCKSAIEGNSTLFQSLLLGRVFVGRCAVASFRLLLGLSSPPIVYTRQPSPTTPRQTYQNGWTATLSKTIRSSRVCLSLSVRLSYAVFYLCFCLFILSFFSSQVSVSNGGGFYSATIALVLSGLVVLVVTSSVHSLHFPTWKRHFMCFHNDTRHTQRPQALPLFF